MLCLSSASSVALRHTSRREEEVEVKIFAMISLTGGDGRRSRCYPDWSYEQVGSHKVQMHYHR